MLSILNMFSNFHPRSYPRAAANSGLPRVQLLRKFLADPTTKGFFSSSRRQSPCIYFSTYWYWDGIAIFFCFLPYSDNIEKPETKSGDIY